MVRSILADPLRRQWTLQGFGMLRTYLDLDHVYRLHIWSKDHAVPNVSELHTHPWAFQSLIVGGEVCNERYEEGDGRRYHRQLIKCGVGGCLVGEPDLVELVGKPSELYVEGDVYSQRPEEIHRSVPADGTVTLLERQFGADVDHAHVYFPEGTSWVSAEPRDATDKEVLDICGLALGKWFP